MLAQVKEVDNNGVTEKILVPLTSDVGAGAPVGTIIAQYKKADPEGYLYLDGSTFDADQYPALYMYLGSNTLPDYREFALVGAEQNSTDTIAAHDVYTQGQGKDDQIQNITGSFNRYLATQQGYQYTFSPTNIFGAFGTTGSGPTLQSVSGLTAGSNKATDINFDASRVARAGTVTRGKRKAVFFYIKATAGLPENQQENVLNAAKSYVDGKTEYVKVVDGIITIKKFGRVVTIDFVKESIAAGVAYVDIYQLPEQYRPETSIYVYTIADNNNKSMIGYMSNGIIRVYSYQLALDRVYGHVSYIV